jgi:putative YphP/YqiW family bacilliredoxin
MYPEALILPMREQMVRAGFKETRTASEVDAALALPGTTLLVVNAICDCAAARMRPGVRLALKNSTHLPDHGITVFAGQDTEATERARSYFAPNPPSSPAAALLRGGKLLYLLQRDGIETSTPQQVADKLMHAMAQFCAKETA